MIKFLFSALSILNLMPLVSANSGDSMALRRLLQKERESAMSLRQIADEKEQQLWETNPKLARKLAVSKNHSDTNFYRCTVLACLPVALVTGYNCLCVPENCGPECVPDLVIAVLSGALGGYGLIEMDRLDCELLNIKEKVDAAVRRKYHLE